MLGQGLAINATIVNQDNGSDRALDSGVIEVPLAFGLPLGAAWLAAHAQLPSVAGRVLIRSLDRLTAGAVVIVLISGIQVWFGNPFHSDAGILFWSFVGLVLAERRRLARGR